MVRKGKDPWLHMQQLGHYLRTGEYPKTLQRHEKNGIRTAAQSFVLQDDTIFYVGYGLAGALPEENREALESREAMERVLEEVHDKGGHKGTRYTQYKVRQKYYWPTMTQDIRDWINKCPDCLLKREMKTRTPGLISGRVKRRALKRIKGQARTPKDKSLPHSLFERAMANGEVVNREWLEYLPKTGDVSCAPCKLFSHEAPPIANSLTDPDHCQQRITEHEQSVDHTSSITSWLAAMVDAEQADSGLLEEAERERKRWKSILKHAVEAIKFLASRGLGLGEVNEETGCTEDGHYLGVLQLLARTDPRLAQHLELRGAGEGGASCLSQAVCDELVELMAQQVQETILAEVQHAKYYSLSVDSTPDATHADHLSLLLRYLGPDGRPVERFLKFLDVHDHGAESVAAAVLQLVQSCGLDLADLRGHSYDNAPNMADTYTGLRSRIQGLNPLACLVPCAAHSLPMVGLQAASSCPEAVSFFRFVEGLYGFFAASTHRWEQLQGVLPEEGMAVAAPSDMPWSSRADAVKALCLHYQQVKAALQQVCLDTRQTMSIRLEGQSFAQQMEAPETAFMAVLWHRVLGRLSATSATLQALEGDLLAITKLYKGLAGFLAKTRQEQFLEVDGQAAAMLTDPVSGEGGGSGGGEGKQWHHHGEGGVGDDGGTVAGGTVQLEPGSEYRADTFNRVLDGVSAEVLQRVNAYARLHEMFGFLSSHESMSDAAVRAQLDRLAATFRSDIEPCVAEEFVHLRDIQAGRADQSLAAAAVLLRPKDGVLSDAFPNMSILVRIFLSLPITTCEATGTPSTLARTKTYLRSTKPWQRVNPLALLCIESRLSQALDADAIVGKFASSRTGRRYL